MTKKSVFRFFLVSGILLQGTLYCAADEFDPAFLDAEVKLLSAEALREQLQEQYTVLEARDKQIAELKHAQEEMTESFRQQMEKIEQKDKTVALDEAVVARDTALAQRDEVIVARDAALAQLESVASVPEAAESSSADALAFEETERDTTQLDAANRVENMETERKVFLAQIEQLKSENETLKASSVRIQEVEAQKDSEISRLQDALTALMTANHAERFVLAYNLGSIYKAARQFDRAEAEFLKALTLKPDDSALHFNLGILYDDNLKDSKKARYHYERFLALAPNDKDAPNVIKWIEELP